MFPISSEQTLPFIDIAYHWVREIRPLVRPLELRDALSKAWWRGELVAANGPSRVHLLRGLHSKCADEIAFVIPGAPELPCSRPLGDGGVEVFRLVRVPLPNAQSDTWTDANCTEAFNAIAEAWDEELFWLLAYEVPFIMLTRSEFAQWAKKCGHESPTFWGKEPTSKTVRRKPGRKATHAQAIDSALVELFEYHGNLQDTDPDWATQADAERAVFEKLGDKAPAESTVRKYVSKFIANREKVSA
jgi:hypothetical protein